MAYAEPNLVQLFCNLAELSPRDYGRSVGEAVVEFPDGEIVRGVFPSNATIEQQTFAQNVRTQDVLFVIDKFSKGKEITEQKDCTGDWK